MLNAKPDLAARLSSLSLALAPLDSDASENIDLAVRCLRAGRPVDAYVAVSGLGRSLFLPEHRDLVVEAIVLEAILLGAGDEVAA